MRSSNRTAGKDDVLDRFRAFGQSPQKGGETQVVNSETDTNVQTGGGQLTPGQVTTPAQTAILNQYRSLEGVEGVITPGTDISNLSDADRQFLNVVEVSGGAEVVIDDLNKNYDMNIVVDRVEPNLEVEEVSIDANQSVQQPDPEPVVNQADESMVAFFNRIRALENQDDVPPPQVTGVDDLSERELAFYNDLSDQGILSNSLTDIEIDALSNYQVETVGGVRPPQSREFGDLSNENKDFITRYRVENYWENINVPDSQLEQIPDETLEEVSEVLPESTVVINEPSSQDTPDTLSQQSDLPIELSDIQQLAIEKGLSPDGLTRDQIFSLLEEDDL